MLHTQNAATDYGDPSLMEGNSYIHTELGENLAIDAKEYTGPRSMLIKQLSKLAKDASISIKGVEGELAKAKLSKNKKKPGDNIQCIENRIRRLAAERDLCLSLQSHILSYQVEDEANVDQEDEANKNHRCQYIKDEISHYGHLKYVKKAIINYFSMIPESHVESNENNGIAPIAVEHIIARKNLIAATILSLTKSQIIDLIYGLDTNTLESIYLLSLTEDPDGDLLDDTIPAQPSKKLPSLTYYDNRRDWDGVAEKVVPGYMKVTSSHLDYINYKKDHQE